MPHDRRQRAGMLLGSGAVLCWSLTGASTALLGRSLGVWPFLAIACGIGGLALAAYQLCTGRSLRSIIAMPVKLWLITIIAFPFMQVMYASALAGSATEAQTIGVNLINYLWPTLTVVLACAWVPGSRWSPKLALAVVVAFAGLVVGNWSGLRTILGSTGGTPLPALPYFMIFLAAVSWAVYSSLLARWREWADRYSTATAGFLTASVVAAIIATVRGDWGPVGGWALAGVVVTGLVPFGAGYMLWELAVHRAPAEKLGLLGSVTTVLSTLVIYLVFALLSSLEKPTAMNVLRQVVAALLVAAAVLISFLPAAARRSDSPTLH